MVLTTRQIKNYWQKVNKTDSCWDWTGYTASGYGKVNLNGRVYFAHRVALLLSGVKFAPSKKELGASGEIVMHRCDRRSCVNPAHLKLTDQKENMHDAHTKHRKWHGELSGESNGRAKLTERKVSALRLLFRSAKNINFASLAHSLGVNVTQLYLIRSNKSWTHVK